MRYIAKIEGMGCAHCIARVTNALKALGADAEEVKLGSARFSYEGETADVKDAIEDLGFDVIDIKEA
ncbi:MAG: heavy-metal-associated domain-containing protein [Christensenellales bacterium]